MFEIPSIKGKKDLVITKDVVESKGKIDINALIGQKQIAG